MPAKNADETNYLLDWGRGIFRMHFLPAIPLDNALLAHIVRFGIVAGEIKAVT